jgi:hypothetical protein
LIAKPFGGAIFANARSNFERVLIDAGRVRGFFRALGFRRF